MVILRSLCRCSAPGSILKECGFITGQIMGNPVERRGTENSIPERLSILIVDRQDEAGILEQEIGLLGHLSQVVFSYKDSFEKLKKNHFDLIIMDMDLQEGDWLSTVVWIREVLGNIHIITMTKNNRREIEELAREQKVIYYIVKPFDLKEMRSVIDHISKKINRNI